MLETSSKRSLRKGLIQVPQQYKQRFEQALLRDNVRRMYYLAIYTVAIQVSMFAINQLIPSSSNGDGAADSIDIISYYIMMSISLLAVGVLFLILLRLALNHKITGRTSLLLLTNGMLYLQIAGQVGFGILNALINKSFFSYIIAILVIGAFPILKPLKVILTIVAAFASVFASLMVYYPLPELSEYFFQTDVWSSILIITILTGCMSVIIYGMYVSNFIKSTKLEEHNNELKDFNQRLEETANTDSMTGAYNRRALTAFFSSLSEEPVQQDNKLVVAIFDIDHFKEFNDAFGHLQGDDCLQRIAGSLRNSFRRSQDRVYRYGGEEFLVLFETRADNSAELIEQARKDIEALSIAHTPKRGTSCVTVSAGFCVVEQISQTTVMQALRIADQALYESKDKGRNCSTCGVFPTGRQD